MSEFATAAVGVSEKGIVHIVIEWSALRNDFGLCVSTVCLSTQFMMTAGPVLGPPTCLWCVVGRVRY